MEIFEAVIVSVMSRRVGIYFYVNPTSDRQGFIFVVKVIIIAVFVELWMYANERGFDH